MKIIAVVLLIVGFFLVALAGYGYFFSEDGVQCQRATFEAGAKLKEAQAAQGTVRERDLIEEARIEVNSQEFWCRNLKRTQQQALLTVLGGVIALVVALVLMVKARNRPV